MSIRLPEEMAALAAKRFSAKAAEWLYAEAFSEVSGEAHAEAGESASEAAESPEAADAAEPAFDRPLGRAAEEAEGRDLAGLQRVIEAWRAAERRPGWCVIWRTVHWRRMGISLELPSRVIFEKPEDLVRAAAPRGLTPEGWQDAVRRLREAAAQLGVRRPESRQQLLHALRQAKMLWPMDAPREEAERLVRFAKWLADHPASGLYLREVPVEGIDTKWAEKNLRAAEALWRLALESQGREVPDAGEDFLAAAGLAAKPLFVCVRHASAWTGGSAEDAVQLTLERLAELPPAWAGRQITAAVIENAVTGFAADIPEDIPVIIGMGYGVSALARIPWLAHARILYFGDLDTHGLAILAECRRTFPQTESVLMTPEVFLAFERLAAAEPRPAEKRPAELTASETELWELLRQRAAAGRPARLEQERIPAAAVAAGFAEALRTLRAQQA